MPIEFLDAEQPAPAGPEPPARRSLLVRLLAGAAVVAAVLAWALTRPDGGGTTAVPRATPTPTATGHLAPATVRCSTGGPVTTELASAMQHFLPTLRVDNLRVYRCVRGSGPAARIVFEAVSSVYRGQHIDVEASVRGVGDPAVSPHLGATDDSYVTVARIDTLAAGLRVSVVDWAPRGAHPKIPAGPMSKLADFVSLNVIL